jgi:hypothetical protein
MKAGAHDYIIGQSGELVPAVERELRIGSTPRRGLLKELRKEREFIDAVLNNVEMLVWTRPKDIDNRPVKPPPLFLFEVKDRPFWDISYLPKRSRP